MEKGKNEETEGRIFTIHSLGVMLEVGRNGDNDKDALERISNGSSHVISNMARLIQREAEELINTM